MSTLSVNKIDTGNLYVSGSLTTTNITIIGPIGSANLRITGTGVNDAVVVESGNVLIGRTNSTVGQGTKLDINGAVNASAFLISGAVVNTAPAYERANTPNIYIANTNNLGVTTTFSSTPRTLNFISASANSGIDVIINDFSSALTSNITVAHYDVLQDNVAITAGSSSVVINNTVITRPYRRLSFFLYEASLSVSGIVQVRYSVNNGTTIRGMDAGTITNSGNTLYVFTFFENAQFLSRTHRRRGFHNSITYDGVNHSSSSNFYQTNSEPGADGYINWLNYFVSSGGGTFNGGYVTLIGYR